MQIAQASAGKKSINLKKFFNHKKKQIENARQLIALKRKIDTIIRHMNSNDKIYKDETGYQKEETQKKEILETEIF
jgi:ribosomal protein S15P/S13E